MVLLPTARQRRAAEQRYELASSRLIKLHSVPSQPGPNCRISKFARTNQRVSERLYNLSVVARPLATSEMGRSSPAPNSLAAAAGKGAFWHKQETTSGTMRSSRRQGEDMTDQGFGRRDFLKT